MTCRKELLLFAEIVLEILENSKDLEDAKEQVMDYYMRLKAGAFDEFLNALGKTPD